jgi:hypothetical protein
MPKSSATIIVLALSAIVFLGAADSAFAQKKVRKLTYEEAWRRCKAHIDRNYIVFDHVARYSAGRSCMLRFGYNI